MFGIAFGSFAEYVVAPALTTYLLPDELTFAEGAALPLNYLTALWAFQYRGRLRAGETVLAHGAGGGTGTAAIQVARALGAVVYGVVSSQAKADTATAAGAQHVLGVSGA